MEYKLECPGFFLRTETCAGPVSRFDEAALAPDRQCLALEGLPRAEAAALLVRLTALLREEGMTVRAVPSPDLPGLPDALVLGSGLLILPEQLLTSPDARAAAWRLPLSLPHPDRAARSQAALLRDCRDRLLSQGRLYLLTGAAAREECRQAVRQDADPRKIRRLGERLIAQEFPRGGTGGIREEFLTAIGAAGQQIAGSFPEGWRILRLEDPYGAFAPELLTQLSATARERRLEQILSRCPLSSDHLPEHLFLPGLGLGFVTSNHFHTLPDTPDRVINARRFVSAACLREEKTLLLDRKRLQRQSLAGAARSFGEAGALDRELDTLLLPLPTDYDPERAAGVLYGRVRELEGL